MERQRYRELFTLLKQAAQGHRQDPRCTHSDRTIVAVLLWAALHDKPILWAAQPGNWPGDLRPRPLPSQSCLSRRLRQPGVLALLERFHQQLQTHLPASDLKLIDGRPLPVGGCSKDRQAGYGYGAGLKQRGYKLHLWCDLQGRVEQWLVGPMNYAEPAAAVALIQHAGPAAYVLGDANYDNNTLYEQAGQRGLQWIALPRYARSRAPGHRRHSDYRLRVWAWLQSKAGRRVVRRARTAIERINGWQGQACINLGRLPHHIRGLHRVRLWTGMKIIIYHHWLIAKRQRQTA